MEKIRMHYSRYKKHYSDCETEKESYDKSTKTIVVIIPNGRMKKSGVRGKSFYGYKFRFTTKEGTFTVTYRAVCQENAVKNLIKDFKPLSYEVLNRY